MREVDVHKIQELVRDACGHMNVFYPEDIVKALAQGKENETDPRSRTAMDMLLRNAEIARTEGIPICQDTGMVTVYLKIGQDVHFCGGTLQDAIQNGVAEGYTQNYLRASVVQDPVFDRCNTRNNTPVIVYTSIVPGEEVQIELTAKGFGSENMSRIAMLKPAQGVEGVKQFILETIRLAGPNACPPMIVGVGIGGTFDYSAVLAKRALLQPFEMTYEDARYESLRKELYEEANALKIGPMGLHGQTSVLHISIEHAPTHIAGMPVAVNICCHACRHEVIHI